jgi:hypothetical protein
MSPLDLLFSKDTQFKKHQLRPYLPGLNVGSAGKASKNKPSPPSPTYWNLLVIRQLGPDTAMPLRAGGQGRGERQHSDD